MHADAIRDVFKLVRKDEEFAIDVDILVEMYLVNTTERKQYVRGFNFTWEVDGKALPLILQKDFYAYELDGTHYEYCLNISPNQLDHSKLETLPPLYPRLPLELEARRPLEGWVHFVIKDADPEKVYKNHSYKFSVVDSLDNEHPILKAIMDDRAGTISVRRILANA
jgi:hypothetical protein